MIKKWSILLRLLFSKLSIKIKNSYKVNYKTVFIREISFPIKYCGIFYGILQSILFLEVHKKSKKMHVIKCDGLIWKKTIFYMQKECTKSSTSWSGLIWCPTMNFKWTTIILFIFIPWLCIFFKMEEIFYS